MTALEQVLGEGGMGRVWLARNLHLDSPVALKLVQLRTQGAETAARLLTEARVEANLRHANIVRVFDYQARADIAYTVMEQLEGCSLADVIDSSALPPCDAVQLLLPVIDALCVAHRAGIVHRDVKPENIFIARSDDGLCPKLLDFGVAKIGDFDRQVAKDGRLIVGSPGYMSPEQARGEPDVDERTDVWAMCVVLYEAITGVVAFEATGYAQYMVELESRELAPLHGRHLDTLWPILHRGLARKREDRTLTMRELGIALAHWLMTQGVSDDVVGDSLARNWLAGTHQRARMVERGPLDSRSPTHSTRRAVFRSSNGTGSGAPLGWLANVAPSVVSLGVAAVMFLIGASCALLWPHQHGPAIFAQRSSAGAPERASAAAVLSGTSRVAHVVQNTPGADTGTNRAVKHSAIRTRSIGRSGDAQQAKAEAAHPIDAVALGLKNPW
jgi:serine/threonine protein kinase